MSVYILLCLFWGTTVNAIKIGVVNGFTKFIFASGRFFFAGIFILITILFQNKNLPIKQKLKVAKGDKWKILSLTFLMFVIPYTSLYSAIIYLPSGILGIIGATIPLYTMIFAHFILDDERFTLFKILGLFLGIAGLTLLAVSGDKSFKTNSSKFLTGFFIALIGYISFGFANAFAKKYKIKTSFKVSTFYQTISGGIILFVLSLIFDDFSKLNPNFKAVSSLIYISIFGTGITFVLYYEMVSRIGASKMSTVPLVIPFVAVIFGHILLNEKLEIYSLLSGLIIISGVSFILLDKK